MNEWMTMEESGLAGFSRQSDGSDARRAKIASAVALWADLINGRTPAWMLAEALRPSSAGTAKIIEGNYPGLMRISETMTTSDFPHLTGDVLDRMLLAKYREFPSPWRQFAKVAQLRDFRTVDRKYVNGLETVWPAVPENAEPEYGALAEGEYNYAPKKYAQAAKISFEALMNDDLGGFTDIPERLARGGARTINRMVTELYVDSSGPHASLYDAVYGNVITGNPVLSVTALGTAFGILGGFTDAGGDPIYVEEAVLVVPPALRVAAQNIMNQITVDITANETNRTVQVNNWIVGNLQMVVDPYIPIVASSSNGNTSWFLFADPAVGRPALEVGFVRGFAEPVLYQKLANTIRVGGGIDQMAGDFGSMSQEYKGVLAFGGTRLDPKATVASEGDGS
jgi:hypothetical protein